MSAKYDSKTKTYTIEVSINSATELAVEINKIALAVAAKPDLYFNSGELHARDAWMGCTSNW